MKKEISLFFWVAALKIIILSALFWSANYSLGELANFGDVQSYLKIAGSYPLPYSLEGMQVNVRHYPLFPFVVWVISPLFAFNLLYAGFFCTILMSSLCCVILYLIAKQFTQKAFEIALIFAVLPDKWAQISVYPLSESIFVLFLLLAVYYHLKGNFAGAYFSLAMLLLARPLGAIFLLSFLFIDIIVEKRFFIIKHAIFATMPFLAFHGYLFLLFHKIMLFVHTEKGAGWGGTVFTYPLYGLIEGIKDPKLLLVRKFYTLSVFLGYLVVFALALYHIFYTRKYWLFSAIIIPYFVFTLFLKGSTYNWWMLALPRFLIPLAPFGLILLFGKVKERYLYIILSISIVMAIAYSIGSHIMHARYGGVV